MQSTTRRKFIAGSALLGASAAMAGEAPVAGNGLPKLLHTVFFWLKNPESGEDRDKLIEGIRTLAAIDTVRAMHVGVPAGTEQRDVVENSWQVSEMLAFDDLEGQSAYQVHPIHQKFVEDYSHLWSKVVVYDAFAV